MTFAEAQVKLNEVRIRKDDIKTRREKVSSEYQDLLRKVQEQQALGNAKEVQELQGGLQKLKVEADGLSEELVNLSNSESKLILEAQEAGLKEVADADKHINLLGEAELAQAREAYLKVVSTIGAAYRELNARTIALHRFEKAELPRDEWRARTPRQAPYGDDFDLEAHRAYGNRPFISTW